MAIPELVDLLAPYTAVAGVGLAPAVKRALEVFWRHDVARNAMREVHSELLIRRPAPGDSKSLDDIYKSLCAQLVNPTFMAAVEDLLVGRGAAVPRIREHLQSHLAIPPTAEREQIVTAILDALMRHVGRAQRDVQAAVDVVVGLSTDRILDAVREVGSQLGSAGWRAETADGICVGEVGGRLVAAITQDDGTVTIRCALSSEVIARFPGIAEDARTAIAINHAGDEGVLITVDKAARLTCHAIHVERATSCALPSFEFDISGVPHLLDIQRSGAHAVIMITSSNGELEIRRWPTGEPLGSHDALPITNALALGLIWRRRRPIVLVSTPDAVLRMYDVVTGEPCEQPWPIRGSRVYALATSTYRRRPVLFTGDAQGEVHMWDSRDRTRIGSSYRGQTGTICSIFLGKWQTKRIVASASMDGRVVVWDLISRAVLT